MRLRLFIILGVLGLAEYYSFILVRSSVRNLSPVWRTTVMAVYLVLTALAWLGIVFFRQMSKEGVPHLLRNIYVAFVLGFFVGKILVLLVMFIDDVRRLITWIAGLITHQATAGADSAAHGISRSLFLKRTALILGGLSLVGFTYGIRNRYNYRVRKIKLKSAAIPAGFKGLKMVQISDIHTGSFDDHSAVARGIQRIMDQKPDLIFFTGDLVNNKSDEVDARYQEVFSRLKAPMGVYSTLGNHDYGDYVQWATPADKIANLNELKRIHAAMGWRLMMNEHIVLERGNDKIALIGIENWSAKANFPRYGDMRKACEGLKEKNIPYKILLSHDPSHWHAQVVPEYGDVNLTLSGHTHGMQFGVDSKWLKWSPIQYMYKEWAGLYTQGEQNLYVNRGFGFLGYPGRLGILPEITVFELG